MEYTTPVISIYTIDNEGRDFDMNIEDKKALIKYRMDNAWDTLKQAKTIYENGHFLGVVDNLLRFC